MKEILKKILEPINKNYDKILHLAVSFMLYTVAYKIKPEAAFVAIVVLLVGLAWELLRKRLYGTPVSNADMLANFIGVMLGLLVSVL